MDDKFRDHCGVVGIIGVPEAAKLVYLALYALQHRGQDAAGIVSIDKYENWHRHVGCGLVADVFDDEILARLKGDMAVGHVRYRTQGDASLMNAQPLMMQSRKGQLAIAHNGNLVNADILKRHLQETGAVFSTTSDTEIIAHLLAKTPELNAQDKLRDALKSVTGAYSLVLAMDGYLIAVRDPCGIRPLVIGRLQDGYMVASEDCAFQLVNAKRIREVEPGEIVLINAAGITSARLDNPSAGKLAPCIFEHVYFARPDSTVFDASVHQSRKAMGKQLARESHVDADVVISVPDSGTIAAMEYAVQSGIPFEMGLVRNHYVGRTFIEPQQGIRHFGVKLKLAAVESVVSGRRLIVIDDSIVRGTTSRKIVELLREAGAKEIHMRIAAPPTRYPCFLGIDTPTRAELIAAHQSVDAIAAYLKADSLHYLSLEGLLSSYGQAYTKKAGACSMCDACFTGNYPVSVLGHSVL